MISFGGGHPDSWPAEAGTDDWVMEKLSSFVQEDLKRTFILWLLRLEEYDCWWVITEVSGYESRGSFRGFNSRPKKRGETKVKRGRGKVGRKEKRIIVIDAQLSVEWWIWTFWTPVCFHNPQGHHCYWFSYWPFSWVVPPISLSDSDHQITGQTWGTLWGWVHDKHICV